MTTQRAIMDAPARPELSAPALRAWLQGLEPGSVAGLAGDARHCPLANYLDAVTDHEWEVQLSRCICSPEPGFYLHMGLPTWADQFVGLVDDKGRQVCEQGHMAVSREMALRLREQALAMEERNKVEFEAMVARHQAGGEQGS